MVTSLPAAGVVPLATVLSLTRSPLSILAQRCSTARLILEATSRLCLSLPTCRHTPLMVYNAQFI